jgi:hypothetical protein
MYIVHCNLYTLLTTFTTLILHPLGPPKNRKQNKKEITLLYRIFLEYRLETERLKRHTVANEMLAHGLDPMQTQRMQHGARALHDTQHHDRGCEPEVEDGDHHEGACDAGDGECVLHRHVPEHNGETLMGEGQGPKTQVRGCVGDAVETEFWEVLVVTYKCQDTDIGLPIV